MRAAGTPMVRSILAASAAASVSTGLTSSRPVDVSSVKFTSRARNAGADDAMRRTTGARFALGFEESLTQVDEVTLGLLFAAAPAIVVRDAHAAKQVLAGDDDVARDEAAVLEREDVEGALELVPGEQQRNCQPAALPRRRQRDRARRGRRTSPVRQGRASARRRLHHRASPAHRRRATAAASRKSPAGRPRAPRGPRAGGRSGRRPMVTPLTPLY